MNLAQVIRPDDEMLPLQGGGSDGAIPDWLYPGRGRPKLIPENAYQPNAPRPAAPPEPDVRVHLSPKRDEPIRENCVRRALRAAGREVMAVLQGRRERLSFSELHRQLPHVPETTLQVRLSNMVSRGDIVREGSFRSYRYGPATEAST